MVPPPPICSMQKVTAGTPAFEQINLDSHMLEKPKHQQHQKKVFLVFHLSASLFTFVYFVFICHRLYRGYPILANPVAMVIATFLSAWLPLIDQNQPRYLCLWSISLGETFRYFVVVISRRRPQFMQDVTGCSGTQSMWCRPAGDRRPHIWIHPFLFVPLAFILLERDSCAVFSCYSFMELNGHDLRESSKFRINSNFSRLKPLIKSPNLVALLEG